MTTVRSLFILFLSLLISACSKTGGTKTSVKLNVTGIASLSATAGSGGTMLFGRSATGDMFGKIINGTEETLDVPNGDWTFYALMWDTNSSGLPLNDKVFCSKMPAKLGGTDLSLTFNLSNSNCTDPDFSNGKHYTSAGLVRFSDIFVEECDDITATTNWFCGVGNQGSALSYRLKFQNFKKPGSGGFVFGPEVMASACKKVDLADSTDLMNQGLPVNFPSGNGVSPFVVSIELFLGSNTCDTNDAKGVHSILLNNGLSSPGGGPNKVLTSTTSCSFTTPDWPVDLNEKRNLCDAYYGSWASSTCSSIPASITRFAPTCGTQSSGQTPVIKHLIALPKPAVCDKYAGVYSNIGSHPFAGGNGTIERPYKICTEWQLNQIGEYNAPVSYASSSFKLMNDMDMNKTDIIFPASKPYCNGQVGSVVDRHHNLNPLDVVTTNCTAINGLGGYSGTFNGNGKTIHYARIQVESADELGLVRRLTGNGRIVNLKFKNAEVEGLNNVGTVAGTMATGTSRINNIVVESPRIEARSQNGTNGSFAGGIVGNITGTNAEVTNVRVLNAEIRGRHHLGGIIGQSYGILKNAHFRGTITSHESGTGSVGGLVGMSGSGTQISSSLSEGMIDSSLQFIGGIAGTFSGTMNNTYSTMAIVSRYSSAAKLGGIIADATSASISNVYFDGSLQYLGGGTPTINGVYVTGTGGTNCYSSYAANPGSCAQILSNNLRTSLPTFSTPADWVFTSGSLPRLAWETRPCLHSSNQQSVAGQVTAGRGAAANPVILCNFSQLTSLSGRPQTEYYKMADDINLSSLTPATTVASFAGQLDGGGSILYGMYMTYVAGDNASSFEGLFRSASSGSSIKNLQLYGNTLINTAGTNDTGTGLLVGQNLGTVSDIILMSNKVQGYSKTGSVVGHNKNILKNVFVDGGEVKGELQIGGLAGFNETPGKIGKSSVRADVLPLGTVFTAIGGVAGLNSGEMDQVQFKGYLKSTSSTSNANNARVGGIVGYNLSGGTLTNTLFGNDASVQLANANYVGGIAGQNDGSINLSVALGKLIYSNAGANATPGENFHPVAGFTSGGTTGSYVLALQNKIASLKNQTTTGAACVGDGTTTCPVAPSISVDVDLFETSFGGGGSLKTLNPIVSATSTNFTFTGDNLASSTSLNMYKSFTLSNTTAIRTLTEMGTLSTLCPSGFSSNDAAGSCTGGFNIAEMNGYGSNRIINYFMALMYNQPEPANSPVWEFSTDEGPRLLQVDD